MAGTSGDAARLMLTSLPIWQRLNSLTKQPRRCPCKRSMTVCVLRPIRPIISTGSDNIRPWASRRFTSTTAGAISSNLSIFLDARFSPHLRDRRREEGSKIRLEMQPRSGALLEERWMSDWRHICVDMQRLFAEDTPWHVPWMVSVLPPVEEMVGHFPDRTIFTLFTPPDDLSEAPGAWRAYYEKWSAMTGERLPAQMTDVVQPLKSFIPPARTFHKSTYSPWIDGRLNRMLRAEGVSRLVITGAKRMFVFLRRSLEPSTSAMRRPCFGMPSAVVSMKPMMPA